MSKDHSEMNHSEINACIQTLMLVISELDF